MDGYRVSISLKTWETKYMDNCLSFSSWTSIALTACLVVSRYIINSSPDNGLLKHGGFTKYSLILSNAFMYSSIHSNLLDLHIALKNMRQTSPDFVMNRFSTARHLFKDCNYFIFFSGVMSIIARDFKRCISIPLIDTMNPRKFLPVSSKNSFLD